MDTLAQRLGFVVTKYEPRNAPWSSLPQLAVKHGSALAILSVWLYTAARMNKGVVRGTMGMMAAVALLVWPSELGAGRSGLKIVDFGMPAWAFLVTLNVVAAFFLRDIEEVHSWSFARTICQMFAYVNEDKDDHSNARLENLKALRLCVFKYLGVNLLLYAIPSPEIWATIRPLSIPFFFHAGVVAMTVLGTLGFLIEGALRMIGFGFGIEMSPLFNNPMVASNPREFWARWNLAVKDGLSRVFFHFKAPPARRSVKSKASNGASNGSSTGVALQTNDRNLRSRSKKPDYLSETEAEHSDAGSRAPSPDRLDRKLLKKKLPADSKRKPSPFLPKALAAVVTFAASGLFHEYMNALAFSGASGETVLFFLSQSLLTVSYSYIARNYPALPRNCPRWLGVVIVNFFAFLTAPLFCVPFLRCGFFEDLKAFGLLGPVKEFIWVVGDGYGGHLPKFMK